MGFAKGAMISFGEEMLLLCFAALSAAFLCVLCGLKKGTQISTDMTQINADSSVAYAFDAVVKIQDTKRHKEDAKFHKESP